MCNWLYIHKNQWLSRIKNKIVGCSILYFQYAKDSCLVKSQSYCDRNFLKLYSTIKHKKIVLNHAVFEVNNEVKKGVEKMRDEIFDSKYTKFQKHHWDSSLLMNRDKSSSTQIGVVCLKILSFWHSVSKPQIIANFYLV